MKEMRKWAYEIHSSFLGPGAVSRRGTHRVTASKKVGKPFKIFISFIHSQPLRLSNVEESVARGIDRVLEKQFDQETQLRKVHEKSIFNQIYRTREGQY